MLTLLALVLGATVSDASKDPAAQLARKTLAAELGIAESSIRVQSVAAAEWPDASLGCPRKGMQYAQVITPRSSTSRRSTKRPKKTRISPRLRASASWRGAIWPAASGFPPRR